VEAVSRRLSFLSIVLVQCCLAAAVSGGTLYRVGNTVLKLEPNGEWSVYFRNQLAVKHFVIAARFTDSPAMRAWPGRMNVSVRHAAEMDRILVDFSYRADERFRYSVGIAADSLTIEPKMPGDVAHGSLSFLIPNSFINRSTLRAAGAQRQYELKEDPNFPLKVGDGKRKLAFSGALHLDLIQHERKMNILLRDWSFGKAMFQDSRHSSDRAYQNCYRVTMARNDRPFTGRMIVQFAGHDDASFTPIDLNEVANIGLKDEVAGDRKGGWNDGGPRNSLNDFPVGKSLFLGVPFQIRDPKQCPDRVGVHVYAKEHGEMYPKEVSIPVNVRAGALYFLQATAWNGKNDDVAAYTLSFEDGTTAEKVIQRDRDVFGWYYLGRNKNPACLPAWTGLNGKGRDVGIALYEWRNPCPNKRIAHLTIRSLESSSILGVLGVTASDRALSIVRDALQREPAHVPRLAVACTYGRITGRRWVVGRIQQMLKDDPTFKFLLMRGTSSDDEKTTVYGVDSKARVVAFVDHKAYPQTWGRSALGPDLQLGDKDAAAVRGILERGGGLFVSVPPVELAKIADVLPVEPAAEPVFNTIQAQELVLMGRTDDKHPVTAGIRWDEMRPLGCTFPCRVRKGAAVIAAFNTGEPAIVAGEYGKGRVVYAAFPPGSDALGKSAPWLGLFYDMSLFYLKAFYWLAGNDAFAEDLSLYAPCHTLRDRYTKQSAAIALTAGDLAAVREYLKNESDTRDIDSLLKKWRELDETLSAADDLLLSWKCRDAHSSYTKAVHDVEVLHTDMVESLRSLAKHKSFRAISVSTGNPMLVGCHAFPATSYMREPQHWPARKHAFEHQMKKFVRAGFNHSAYPAGGLSTFVKSGADPTTVEPSDFKLSFFDDFVDICEKHSWTTYIHLIGQPHGRSWAGYHGKEVNDKDYFTQGCPSRRPITKLKGRPMPKELGAVFDTSTFDPLAVARRRQALKIVAAHFRDRPAVLGFQNENEDCCEVRYVEELDIKAFRTHLRERFGTVAAMNVSLGTDFGNFATVMPPTAEEMKELQPGPHPKRGIWYAWARFIRDHDAAYFQDDCKAILSGAPGKEVMERETPSNTVASNRGILRLKEYEHFVKFYGTTGIHLSSDMVCDFMRGFAPGKRLGLSEWYNMFGDTYHGGIVGRPEIDGNYQLLTVPCEQRTSAFVRFNMWGKLARGVRVIQNHMISRDVRAASTMTVNEHCLMQGDGYFKRSAYTQVEVARSLANMAGLLDGAKPCSQVAILHSRASEIQSYGSEIDLALNGTTYNEIMLIYSLFMKDFQRQIDWIPPLSDLSAYRVVICPFTLFLDNPVADNLLNFLRAGGVVLATGPIGMYDPYGKPGWSFLKQSLGRTPQVARVENTDLLVALPGGSKACSADYAVAFENLPESVTKTVYSNGKTALFDAAVGRGRLFVSGFAAYASEAGRDFLRQALEFVEPEAECDEVNLFKGRNAEQHVLYLLNANARRTIAKVRLPAKRARVSDLRVGLEFDADGGFSVAFPEMGCRIYAWEARAE